MEYAVPREAGLEALRECRRALDASDLRISFPVEIRVAPADDIPLSTAGGRDSFYLAFHTHRDAEHRDYFALMEPILRAHDGRPHWGKVHTRDRGRPRAGVPAVRGVPGPARPAGPAAGLRQRLPAPRAGRLTEPFRAPIASGGVMTDRARREFPEFVAARGGALQRAAYLMVGEAALAQDLVQEALTKTYVAWPRLRDPANAEAYTRKVITTTALSWFRRKGWSAERATAVLPESPTPSHDDAVTTSALLWQCLGELPARQRVAVVLRYYEDLTEAQTAEAMGCAVGTVKSQVSAALTKLRARLGDDVLEAIR